MKIKKYLAVALGVLLLPNAIFANEIDIFVNQKPITMDVKPRLEGGITFVPISFIAKELGALVEWRSPQVWIQATRGSIWLEVDSKKATVYSGEMELVEAPKLVDGRVLVPLRFVSEALGSTVVYNQEKQTIHIDKLNNYSATSVYDSYSDKCICAIYNEKGSERIGWFVHDEETDTWAKFDERYEPYLGIQEGRLPRAVPPEKLWSFQEDYGSVDLNNNTFIKDFEFILSPNKKYAYTHRIQYRDDKKYEAFLVKNMKTGEIREVFRSYIGDSVNWFKDNTLKRTLGEADGYGYQIYNPETKMYRYVASEEWEKIDNLKAPYPYSETRNHKVPEDIKFDKLSIITLTDTVKMEAVLKINNQKIPVPFAFEKDEDSYVPLKYVIQAVGGQVEKDKVYKYKDQELELTEENTARYKQQFYVSKKVLETIGIIVEVEYLKE